MIRSHFVILCLLVLHAASEYNFTGVVLLIPKLLIVNLHQDIQDEMTIRANALIKSMLSVLPQDQVHILSTNTKEAWKLDILSKTVHHLIYLYDNTFAINLICSHRVWPSVRKFQHISFFTLQTDHRNIVPWKQLENVYTKEKICNRRPFLPDNLKVTFALSRFNSILSGVRESMEYAQFALPQVKVVYVPPPLAINFQVSDKPTDVINIYLEYRNKSPSVSSACAEYILNIIRLYRDKQSTDPDYLPIQLIVSEQLPSNISEITSYTIASSNFTRSQFISMMESLHVVTTAVRYGAENIVLEAQALGAMLLAPKDFIKQEFHPLEHSIICNFARKSAERLHYFFNKKKEAAFKEYSAANVEWARQRFTPELTAEHYLRAIDSQ